MHVPRHVVAFEPSGYSVSVNSTTTILEAARSLGLFIPSDCGGQGTCGKCRVTFRPVSIPTEKDLRHLSPFEIATGFRLACEHVIDRRTWVTLPQTVQAKILTSGKSKPMKRQRDPGLVGQKGVAIDLGTTTVVAYLMDLQTGVQLAQAATLNPQIAFGEDVMSRIDFATRAESGGAALRERILSCIDELVMQLLTIAAMSPKVVSRLSIVGNTAMHHLLLGLDVSTLGLAPYKPLMRHSVTSSVESLGLKSVGSAEAYIAPNIAGFVGGDAVGFILSQGLDSGKDTILGIDIGTNAEIVLAHNGKAVCCSAAAGPAFEGARITHGMRGQDGAIEHVHIDDPENPPDLFVIGDSPPQGLCGSGILDTVAELRRVGIIDRKGRMYPSARVNRGEQGLYYVLTGSVDSDTESRIVFTQSDVRQVQLAKAAISAGTRVLMEVCGVRPADIDLLFLAGAFGNYLRPESALRIGLFPPIPVDRIVPVGNAAGEGAKRLLLSSRERAHAERLIDEVEYIELATHPSFAQMFMEATLLESEPQGMV